MSYISDNAQWIERRRGKRRSVRKKTYEIESDNPFVGLEFSNWLNECADATGLDNHAQAAVLAYLVQEVGDELLDEVSEADADDLLDVAESVEADGDERQSVPDPMKGGFFGVGGE
jgi:hypothetical protein